MGVILARKRESEGERGKCSKYGLVCKKSVFSSIKLRIYLRNLTAKKEEKALVRKTGSEFQVPAASLVNATVNVSELVVLAMVASAAWMTLLTLFNLLIREPARITTTHYRYVPFQFHPERSGLYFEPAPIPLRRRRKTNAARKRRRRRMKGTRFTFLGKPIILQKRIGIGESGERVKKKGN